MAKPKAAATHVRVTGELSDSTRFAALLEARGLGGAAATPTVIEPAVATLEDVFLELVERESRGTSPKGATAARTPPPDPGRSAPEGGP